MIEGIPEIKSGKFSEEQLAQSIAAEFKLKSNKDLRNLTVERKQEHYFVKFEADGDRPGTEQTVKLKVNPSSFKTEEIRVTERNNNDDKEEVVLYENYAPTEIAKLFSEISRRHES